MTYLRKYEVVDYDPCDTAHDWGVPSCPVNMVNNVNNGTCGRRLWHHEDLNADTGWGYCIRTGLLNVVPANRDTPSRLSIGAAKPCP
ncbi:hypothetical protein ABZS88_42505 [Streptomyces sp. NPDC005480]|uniref:hypothetical protein n=1 Tax=Streptomyces sp. NPDC005480 TaxID=3154880 RepID=UPI0033BAF03E